MKSILGSDPMERRTDVGGGHAVKYFDVVAGYLKHLKRLARPSSVRRSRTPCSDGRCSSSTTTRRATRPRRRCSPRRARHRVRGDDVPVRADRRGVRPERTVDREQIVLVADIGGGTSDFSVVCVGPQRARRLERKDDILANHGVHIAGTDFDRRIELDGVLGEFGYRSLGPAQNGAPPREVPSAVYFDLATWHLINTVYSRQRVAELRHMRAFYADPRQHRRLMTVLEQRLGHDLLARAEAAKIAVADGGASVIDLGSSSQASAALDEVGALDAIAGDLTRIVDAARRTVADAGCSPATSPRSTSPAARPACACFR